MKKSCWLSLGMMALAMTSLVTAAEPAAKSEDHETYRFGGGVIKHLSEVKPPAAPAPVSAPAIKLASATPAAPVHQVEPACDGVIHAMYRWNSGIIRHIIAGLPTPPAAPAVPVVVTVEVQPVAKVTDAPVPAAKAAPALRGKVQGKSARPVNPKLRAVKRHAVKP